jgi:hypothetical protein
VERLKSGKAGGFGRSAGRYEINGQFFSKFFLTSMGDCRKL